MTKQEAWEEVHDRVVWWLNDMAFKPPELLTPHYYACMAEDIADTAMGEQLGTLTAASRLDPPRRQNV